MGAQDDYVDFPPMVHKSLEAAKAALGGLPLPSFGTGPRTDGPRTNREPGEIDRKRQLRHAAHMDPLASYVDALRREHGHDRVPDFDPTEAGVSAPTLILAEAPGPRATVERGGSGFVSPDNDDASAEAMWRLFAELGIDRATEAGVPQFVGRFGGLGV